MRSIAVFSQAGCLLPFLIIANFFFGWIFLKPLHWLLFELILILLFVLSAFIVTRKFFSAFGKRSDVVDVEGEVVEDKHQLHHKSK